jgi:hypothetical protein
MSFSTTFLSAGHQSRLEQNGCKTNFMYAPWQLCVVPPVCNVNCDEGSMCALSGTGGASSGLLA